MPRFICHQRTGCPVICTGGWSSYSLCEEELPAVDAQDVLLHQVADVFTGSYNKGENA